MNTLHLKYVVEVEKTRSITAAAKNLFMAQPNLSKALKELEDSLGFSIFERTSRGVTPTKKGAEFLHYAKNILQQMNKIEALYAGNEGRQNTAEIATVKAGYINTVTVRFLAGLNFNDTVLDIECLSAEEVFNKVASRQARLGIMRIRESKVKVMEERFKENSLNSDIIWTFNYQLMFSAGHELAEKDVITYEDLKKYLLVCGNEREYSCLDNKSSNIITLNKSELDTSILQNVAGTYTWASPIPNETLTEHSLVQRGCINENENYMDILIYPKGIKFNEIESRFIDCLYQVKKEITFFEHW